MRIILMRHGEPDLDSNEPIKAADFGRWVDAYNRAGIRAQSVPNAEAIALAAQAHCVVCSSLNRSRESATALGLTQIHIHSDLFREMEMPFRSFFTIKLSPNLWAFIFRLSWFLGFHRTDFSTGESFEKSFCESFSAAKIRAQLAARELECLAQEYETVLLIGHGFLNQCIAQYLMQHAWQGSAKTRAHYWSYRVFEFKNASPTLTLP